MRKALPLCVLTASVLVLALLVWGHGVGDAKGGGTSIASFGFGKRLAGGWLTTVDFGNGLFESGLQFAADGGIVGSNTVLVGADGTTSHLTASIGAWQRTGVNTIAVTNLIRIVAADGSLKSYEKVVGEGTVDGDEITGTAAGLIYLPGQDPLDPEEKPVLVLGPGPFSGRRIAVTGLPE